MIKPMLAAVADPDKIEFPVYTQPKLDGIRCLIDPVRGPLTRTGKPIPNRYIRDALGSAGLAGFDGELLIYRRGKMQRFESVSSSVMSEHGQPDFIYHVFDDFSRPERPWEHRLYDLVEDPRFDTYRDLIRLVGFDEAYSEADLMRIHRLYIRERWEGTIIRRPDAPYKFGRSTIRGGELLKLKDFRDDEAEIIGFVERLNHEPSLGAFMVLWHGKSFNIGSGFTEKQRNDFWIRRHTMIGRDVTFQYQDTTRDGIPRFPTFKGMRRDL